MDVSPVHNPSIHTILLSVWTLSVSILRHQIIHQLRPIQIVAGTTISQILYPPLGQLRIISLNLEDLLAFSVACCLHLHVQGIMIASAFLKSTSLRVLHPSSTLEMEVGRDRLPVTPTGLLLLHQPNQEQHYQ